MLHGIVLTSYHLLRAKSLIFVLVRSIEFELAIQPDDIVSKIGGPGLHGTSRGKQQMPLLMRPVKR